MSELIDKFLVARCMYSNGLDYLSDAEYDQLSKQLSQEGYNINPIYEDDPIPYESFSRVLNMNKAEVDELLHVSTAASTDYFSGNKEPDFDFLAESDSLSIKAVTTFREAFNWFLDKQDIDVLISTKIDGINTRRGYIRNDKGLSFNAALTRGRKSDPINITSNMRIISPEQISLDVDSLLVYSETVVPKQTIAVINDKYNSDYSIPRNLAMALMRVDRFDTEDYKQLRSFVFRLDYGSLLSDGIDLAASLGFDVVPYIHYSYKGESYDEFVLHMEEIIKSLKDQTDSMGIVTDGMVAEINDRALFSCGGINNNYSSSNIALKIGLWQPGVYESEVVSLDLSQGGDQCSCVAVVKPVLAEGGQKISRVNCFNPGILFKHDIRPGKRIRFEYKNETTVNILLN